MFGKIFKGMQMLKFWKWLYRYSRKRIRRLHMDAWGTDIKCPNCKQWFSVSGIDHNHTHIRTPDSDLSECVCGQCGHHSFWSSHIAPFPVLVDKDGTPINS